MGRFCAVHRDTRVTEKHGDAAGIRKRRDRAHRSLLLALALLGPAVLAIEGPAAADGCRRHKLDGELQRWTAAAAPGTCRVTPVIVQLAEGACPRQGMAFARSVGCGAAEPLESVHGFRAAATEEAVAALSRNPAVARISADLPVRLQAATAADAAAGSGEAAREWGVSGRGIGIAVLDTGVFRHWDLGPPWASRVVAWRDFVNGREEPYDDNGHGTHVAGIIAGDGRMSLDSGPGAAIRGVAPQAHLIGVKVLDQNGMGRTSDVIAAIDWCLEVAPAYNIRVINLSLGRRPVESFRTDPLCQAVERAWRAGIFVVASAGNGGRDERSRGYGTIDAPANDPLVVAVGALNTRGTTEPGDDTLATYSSKGPSAIDHVLKPDLVAPGNEIVSLHAPAGLLQWSQPDRRVWVWADYRRSWVGEYFRLSGTSMATGVVSGAAALLLERDPSLTPDDLKFRLMATARRIAGSGPLYTLLERGAGALDLQHALRSELRASAAGAPRRLAVSPALHRVQLADGRSVVRVGNAVWPDGDLASDNAIWCDNAIWSDNAIWCDNSPEGRNAIWCDNAIWSDNAIWCDHAITSDNAIWSDGAVGASSAIWSDLLLRGRTLGRE